MFLFFFVADQQTKKVGIILLENIWIKMKFFETLPHSDFFMPNPGVVGSNPAGHLPEVF